MKILSVNQIYQADKATIDNFNISSEHLMERAATICFEWIINRFPLKKDFTFHIFCGIGNNGGDGLVIARKLIIEGFNVKTYVVNFGKNRSEDFTLNYNKLLSISHRPTEIDENYTFPRLGRDSIIIDAIFGIGLTRVPQGFVKELIVDINKSEATVISIDFPSGLFSDNTVVDKSLVVEADFTLTFQNPKIAFLLPENEVFCGQWEILDIGLDKSFIDDLSTNHYYTTIHDVKKIYKRRSKFSHKGTFGHSLIVGGSFGKIGAVVLASKAALKSGSGLVTAFIPKCGYQILQTSIPEVMTEVDDENEMQYFNFKVTPNVIGIGIGMGKSSKTASGFLKFLKTNKVPLVVDADALNILSENKDGLSLLPKDSILTPHPKEFERLVGVWENDFEKLDKLKSFSNENNCIIVLKGANTVIAYKNSLYFNSSGNPSMATAGSGDVLTGIITGLMAQGYLAIEAAVLGVFLHGNSADVAITNNCTLESLIATDIISFLGQSFKNISKTPF